MMSDLGLLFLHLTGDFIAQTDWMASKHSNRAALLAHCATYTVIFAVGFALAGLPWQTVCWLAAVLFFTHLASDWRPWPLGSRWAGKPIMVDQAYHIGVLFLISFYV